MLRQRIMRQKEKDYPILPPSSFGVGQLLLSMGPGSKSDVYVQRDSVGEKKISFVGKY